MAKKKPAATKAKPKATKGRTVSTTAPAAGPVSAPSSATGVVARPKPGPVTDGNPRRLSALDAAARVLAAAGRPMNAKQMIDAMAAQALWTSPGGKTPHATLYSAILREIGAKGDQSRFKKTDRGRFTIG